MAQLSPMMQQYLAVKEQHPNDVVFFRLGDFYEMFFDDAIKVSKELDLTLTGRDCGLPERAPMCGVPHHSAETYIKRLIERGFRIAICEQMENPATAKGVVKRQVTRVITPGTVIESSMLDEDKNNFICAIYATVSGIGLCFGDISTGELHASDITEDFERNLINEMARFSPREIIANDLVLDYTEFSAFLKTKSNASFLLLDDCESDLTSASQIVLSSFHVADLKQLGLDDHSSLIVHAVAELLRYFEKNQIGAWQRVTALHLYNRQQYMNLDLTARRNLEITQTMRTGEKRGTLLWAIDQTQTAMGKRLIRSYLEQPLLNPTLIEKRLNAVGEFVDNSVLRSETIYALEHITDMERLMTRVIYSTATPRELKALQYTCQRLPILRETLQPVRCNLLCNLLADIDPLQDVCDIIEQTIEDNPPITLKDGGVIRKGYHPEVDELRDIINNTKTYIAGVEAKEKAETGIKHLKIGYNRVFGYYIEISKGESEQAPDHYIRKQTLTNCERYITQELKELENKILSASSKIIELEHELFNQVREYVGRQLNRIQKTAQAIAQVDVFSSLAEVAAKNGYVRPEITLGSEITITEGRHPVIERLLPGGTFVANDTQLNGTDHRIAMITGPNMAGKSTYMRQVALIVLMAQIGSFVPAQSARIGIVDSIFTRVGASDDLAAGQSTFMVEMSEVAHILKNATAKSLIILDEVGRGTSTFDGMSIARAILEYIADPKKIGAKTLFATHYHELTAMEEEMSCLKNYNIAVNKKGERITFLRRIIRGAADDSYGIDVAKLAGVPAQVIARSREVLRSIEENREVSMPKALVQKRKVQEDFSAQITFHPMQQEAVIIEQLNRLDLDSMTPLQAFNKLYELKKLAQQ